jgi:hypothetical protein
LCATKAVAKLSSKQASTSHGKQPQVAARCQVTILKVSKYRLDGIIRAHFMLA